MIFPAPLPLLLALFVAPPSDDTAPTARALTLHTWPAHVTMVSREGEVYAVAMVPRHEDNTRLCIEWQHPYPGDGNVSCYDLTEAQRVQYITRIRRVWHRGVLSVVATLERGDGHRRRVFHADAEVEVK